MCLTCLRIIFGISPKATLSHTHTNSFTSFSKAKHAHIYVSCSVITSKRSSDQLSNNYGYFYDANRHKMLLSLLLHAVESVDGLCPQNKPSWILRVFSPLRNFSFCFMIFMKNSSKTHNGRVDQNFHVV